MTIARSVEAPDAEQRPSRFACRAADIESGVSMESWNLNELEVLPHQPEVLDSEAEGRAIVINLPKGEQLQEHQVHERAWLLVVDGIVGITTPDGEDAEGSTGLLAVFDPKERHEVTALEDARLLLVLSPWPGDGHPSQRDSEKLTE
jgi:quercetin dioxygenase-like cupin family protein